MSDAVTISVCEILTFHSAFSLLSFLDPVSSRSSSSSSSPFHYVRRLKATVYDGPRWAFIHVLRSRKWELNVVW
jgi:hypothetical protein